VNVPATLTVIPEPELIVRTPTSLPLVFLDAELPPPVRFGHAWLSPGVELGVLSGAT
jgi:hypothetical protein